MKKDPNKIRVGFYIKKSLLEKSDAMLIPANARSRNEFVNEAIQWYIGYLAAKDSVNILPLPSPLMKPCVTNTVSRRMPLPRKRTESPIGGVLFSYVGTDADFENFLKTVVHDYLMIGDLPLSDTDKSIQKVESSVAFRV